jgi:LAO/AO transport system kinase
LIDDWVESGRVPCQKKNVYKLLSKVTENPSFDLSKPGGLRGRDPLLKPEDLAQVAANLIEVAQSVDMLILLLAPGGGDELQGVKKGIMEVANIFCVTKANGNLLLAAQHTVGDYRTAINFLSTMGKDAGSQKIWRPPVLLTSARTGDGLDEMWETICKYRKHLIDTGHLELQRQKQAKYWMWKQFQKLVQQGKSRKYPRLADVSEQLQEALRLHKLTPRVAAKNLLETLFPDDAK